MTLPHSCFRRPRGATLIETIVSMAIFGVGMLGIIQAQVIAARQNGLARRHSRAAAIARDFTEAARRWEYADPRLAAPPCSPPYTNFPITEAMVGTQRTPSLTFDFTATPASFPQASTEAVTKEALTLSDTIPYDGNALKKLPAGQWGGLLGNPNTDRFQLLWSVRQINTNTRLFGCQAKLVSVVVRYPIGTGDTFRTLATSFVKHDTSTISVGGIAETF